MVLDIVEHDYAHCASCDKVIDLDVDKWYTDGNNTYCEDDKGEIENE